MSGEYVFKSVSTLPDRKEAPLSTLRVIVRAVKKTLDLRRSLLRRWIISRYFPAIRYPDKPSDMMFKVHRLEERGMQHEAAMLRLVAYLTSRVEELEKRGK